MKYKMPKYRMDITCGAVRLIGMALAVAGFVVAYTGDFYIGIAMVVVGAAAILLASEMHTRRVFNRLVARMRETGAEKDLKTSVPACVTLYSAFPKRIMLQYIASHNPKAAQKIAQAIRK